MIRFIYLIAFACLPVQALQILQPENGNEVVNHQAQALDKPSKLSADLLLTKLKKSAKSGDVRSQFSLANMYRSGVGANVDEKLAFYWYMQVAKQGYVNAQFNVANSYYIGAGVDQNLEKALIWYEKAAVQGLTIAQYNLATIYQQMSNTEKAFHWYEKAANDDNGDAQLELAKFYELGISTKKNTSKAQYWYKKAADKSDAQAQFYLADFYQRQNNAKEAFEYYKKSANNRHAQAQFQLGKLLLNKKQTAEAKKWLSKASIQGVDLATDLLKKMTIAKQSPKKPTALTPVKKTKKVKNTLPLVVDKTVKTTTALTVDKIQKTDIRKNNSIKTVKNTLPLVVDKTPKTTKILVVDKPIIINTKKNNSIKKVKKLDKIERKSNTLNAQVKPDFSSLIPTHQQILDSLNSNTKETDNVKKLILSAELGNPIAQHDLSKLYSAGKLVVKDDHKAFLLMQKSANQDITHAQNALAMMYINGMGVETNYQKAYYWASVSARKGDAKGKQILLRLIERKF